MAYIFDPISNTYIDDEDQSLGNKLALSQDAEDIIKKIDEQFGPGTVFPASELPPKENPYKDFEDRNPAANGGMMRKNFAENPLKNFDGLLEANLKKKTESINSFIDKFGKELLDEIAINKYGKNFADLETSDLGNLKKRLLKFEDFVLDNKRMPTEFEARSLGTKDRIKTIMETGGEEVTEEDVRNKLIKDNKYAQRYKGKLIFADKNIQDQFEAELVKRYSFPKTSAAAEAAGVLTDQQLFENYFKPAGFSRKSVPQYINEYKKLLDLDFRELTSEEKQAKNVEREKLERISQGGRRLSGTTDNPVHHMFPLGDQIGAKPEEFTIIPKSINGQIAQSNKKMKKLIAERTKILDQVKIDQTVNIKDLDKKLNDINKRAEEVINSHYKKYPKHQGLLNWKKIDFVLDDVGRLLNVRQVGTIGGDYKKWTLANIDKTILNKDVAKLSKEELRDFRQTINETSTARDAGEKGFGAKEGTPIKNLFTSLKNKLDTSRMFTSRIPGGAIALTPLDFILSMGSGMPLLESAASAGSYLIKDPYLGRAVNIPLAILQDMQDPEATFKKAGERKEKIENFLDNLTGTDSDKPFAPQLIEKLSNMKAGDQPDIDPFQAAKGGRAKLNKGGTVELSPMPRIGFDGGGAVGADDNFAKELEYYFTNPDSKLPEMQTFKETMNPITYLNDMIDPRNYPYYADILARSGVRVAEFGARILPALGQLASDLIQKPAFKVVDADSDYVQDYNLPGGNLFVDEFDMMDTGQKKTLQGTGIFSKFLENITPTSMEKKLGLDKLIESEKQKMIDRGSTSAPVALGETVGLGVELAAPIFPGVKFFQSYAKARNLPADDVTKQIMEKEIDEVLSAKGTDRREFLKVSGAGGAVILAKMLGFGDDFGRVAKVAEKTAVKTANVGGKPVWFDALVSKVIREGDDITKQAATKDRETVHVMKLGEQEGVRVTQDLETGNIIVDYDSPTNMGEQSVTLSYKAPEQLETGQTVPASFEALEVEPRGIRMGPDDYDIEFDGENIVEGIEDLNSDVSSLKQFATGQLDETDLKIREEKLKKVQDLNKNQVSQSEYLETKYGSGEEGSPYYQDFSDYD